MPTVALLGTLDTKGAECAFLRDRVRALGCDVIVVDVGILGPVGAPERAADIGADEVARAAGADRQALAGARDRGPAVLAMMRGATAGGGGGSADVSRTGVAGCFGASSRQRLPMEVAITEDLRHVKRISRAMAAS